MATPRDIRRLAFQILYQLDARATEDAAAVAASLAAEDEEGGDRVEFTASERNKAAALALGAFQDRAVADAFMEIAAPGWPAHRQAAVDRSILRLSHWEMTSGKTHPKIVVNEAVELAKAFSTEKSPAFINGLLDKVLKKVLAASGEVVEADDAVHPSPTETESAEPASS